MGVTCFQVMGGCESVSVPKEGPRRRCLGTPLIPELLHSRLAFKPPPERILRMDEIRSHHFETMSNQYLLVFTEPSIMPGFLRWCEMDFLHRRCKLAKLSCSVAPFYPFFGWLPHQKWPSPKRVPFFSRVTEQLRKATEKSASVSEVPPAPAAEVTSAAAKVCAAAADYFGGAGGSRARRDCN